MERKPNLWLKPVETSSDLISSQMLFEERCWSDTYYTKTNLFVRDIPIVRDC
jgi:hypothetical protein